MRVSRVLLAASFLAALPLADGRAASPDGEACPPPGPVVTGVHFTGTSRIAWEPLPGALAYNLYIDSVPADPPSYNGQCLYAAIPEAATRVHGHAPSGQGWAFQVTGVFADGEGPMGFTSACTPVLAASPCTCALPADPGPCDGICPRWHYSVASGQCEEFIWGCCEGNANNFATEADCQGACLDPCRLPAVVGPCDAVVPRWYFSVLSGSCERFIWGGCGGNANNFPDEAACIDACGDRCLLPLDPGPCDGSCPRWYFNVEIGQCEEFVYGCCGGNANNFPTAAECEAACIDACALPVDPGPCDGSCPRWYFDAETGQCEEFVYGCCGGNANNFMAQEACEAACLP